MYICIITIEKAVDMDYYALTDKVILQEIGKKIRERRLARNLSQKAVAEFGNIALSSVAAVERGESISLKTLLPILRALDALNLLDAFMKAPGISPTAYVKMMEGQKTKKRASGKPILTHKQPSTW